MKTKNANQRVVAVILWTIGAWAAVIIIGGLAAIAVSKQWMGSYEAKRVLFVLSMAILLGFCYVAARRMPQSRMIAALGISTMYTLLGISVGLLGGEGQLGWRLATPLAMGLCAGVLASKKKRRRR